VARFVVALKRFLDFGLAIEISFGRQAKPLAPPTAQTIDPLKVGQAVSPAVAEDWHCARGEKRAGATAEGQSGEL